MLLPIYFPTITCCLCFSPSRAQHFRLFLMKFLSNIQESFPWAVGIISYSDCGLLSLAASHNCGLVYLFFSFKKYIFNKMEYKTSCWITYLKYPSWQWSSTRSSTSTSTELFFNWLCTYPIVIISIPYSLACHICHKVLLKSSTVAFAASSLFTRQATVTKKEMRLIWHQSFLTSLCFLSLFFFFFFLPSLYQLATYELIV